MSAGEWRGYQHPTKKLVQEGASDGAPVVVLTEERAEAYRKATAAIVEIMDLHHLGDAIFRVREVEALGWEGPKVTKYASAVSDLEDALDRLDATEAEGK